MAKVDTKEVQRLDAEAWIAGALTVLSEHGIDGVRVESLAKRLGVTKGSFYWHFKDRDALFEAMLSDWRRRATLQIIDRLEKSKETPQARFKSLLRLPFKGSRASHGAEIELSIRLWGRRDIRARAALEEVDQLRLRYISQLLEEMGIDPVESRARALLVYAYMRVASSLQPQGASSEMERCEAFLLRP